MVLTDWMQGSRISTELLKRLHCMKSALTEIYFWPRQLTAIFRFLQLKGRNPGKILVPSPLIRVAWLSHLIRVSVYIKDCSSLFGVSTIVPYDLLADSKSLPEAEQVLINKYCLISFPRLLCAIGNCSTVPGYVWAFNQCCSDITECSARPRA